MYRHKHYVRSAVCARLCVIFVHVHVHVWWEGSLDQDVCSLINVAVMATDVAVMNAVNSMIPVVRISYFVCVYALAAVTSDYIVLY